jgi:sulfur carrier protein
MITVHLEPEGQTLTFAKLNTVLQLLHKVGRRQSQVLVIRGGELLTQDRTLHRGDEILVRGVTSRG